MKQQLAGAKRKLYSEEVGVKDTDGDTN